MMMQHENTTRYNNMCNDFMEIDELPIHIEIMDVDESSINRHFMEVDDDSIESDSYSDSDSDSDRDSDSEDMICNYYNQNDDCLRGANKSQRRINKRLNQRKKAAKSVCRVVRSPKKWIRRVIFH
jgi:hypothetical protein